MAPSRRTQEALTESLLEEQDTHEIQEHENVDQVSQATQKSTPDQGEHRVSVNATNVGAGRKPQDTAEREGRDETQDVRSVAECSESSREQEETEKLVRVQSRLKYYRRLVSHDMLLPDIAAPPPHVTPPQFFLLPPLPGMHGKNWVALFEGKDPEGLHHDQPGMGSARIFTIVNVMLGSSFLVLPWAFGGSGLLPGLVLVMFIGFLCQYTSSLILRWSFGYQDFSGMCKDYLGVWAWHVALISSLLVLVGALLAYQTLMSDFLHDLTMELSPKSWVSQPFFSEFPMSLLTNRVLSPIPLGVCLFPFTVVKEISTISKFTSWGIVAVIVCVIYIVSFSLGLGIDSIARHGGAIEMTVLNVEPAIGKVSVPLIGSHISPLASILPVSFFVHNLIIPIMEGDDPPRIKMRQHTMAFSIVCLVYLVVGAAPLIAIAGAMQDCLQTPAEQQCSDKMGCAWYSNAQEVFSYGLSGDRDLLGQTVGYLALKVGDPAFLGESVIAANSSTPGPDEPQGKCVQTALSQNFLASKLEPWPSPWVSASLQNAVRGAVLLQLLTIFPLVCAVLRNQFFEYLMGCQYPGPVTALMFGAVAVSFSTFVASHYPDAPGRVLAYVGAISGTLYVFVLPILVNLSALKRSDRLTASAVVVNFSILMLGTFLSTGSLY